jgi:hypothetical protein
MVAIPRVSKRIGLGFIFVILKSQIILRVTAIYVAPLKKKREEPVSRVMLPRHAVIAEEASGTGPLLSTSVREGFTSKRR